MNAGKYLPTGKTRYRIERRGWWRPRNMVVLQIEVTGYDIEWPGMMVDHTFWRDARFTDLTCDVHGVRYGDHRLVMGGP
jgi:hypothetical protein